MNTKNSNSLAMLQATLLCLAQKKTVFQNVPRIVRAVSQLDGIVALILAAQRQESAAEGLAEEKAGAKRVLVEVATDICSVAHACADENDLFALAKRTDLSKSDVEAGKDEKFIDRCKGIHADALVIANEVEDCEITTGQLKALDNAIKKFEAVKSKPRVGISDRKSAGDQFPVLFRRASSLLRNRLDKLVVPFKKTQPEFYGAYKAARRIVNLAATHDAAKVKIVSSGTTAKAA